MTKSDKKYVWMLTTEYNEYDQYGEYFVGVFQEKPSVEALATFCAKEKIYIGADTASGLAFLFHLQKGGGRRGVEEQWYNLKQVECGAHQ
jgi:hypothetical protein